MNTTITINILGTRGSVPVSGAAYALYGGATSCVSVSCKDTRIFLDAGSGIICAPCAAEANVAVMLSHFHLDHMIGLPFFKTLFDKKSSVAIYGRMRSEKSLADALQVLLSPPYWPVGIHDYPADTALYDIEPHFSFGDFTVDTMEGAHPGGSTIYKLSAGDKSFVYATDFEHNEIVNDELIHFAKNTDLLLYDAQYTESEYQPHFGFGHSTPEVGIRIAKKAGAKRLLFTHHAPEHTDEMIAALEESIQKEYPFAGFAKAGTEIILS
ncbi:MAG: MBL fold metallo-hydrolase [Lachnospiraceae bacterium]|nr:MBL fold metallo-hydrolase [Lachnospiraceae bacterium]